MRSAGEGSGPLRATPGLAARRSKTDDDCYRHIDKKDVSGVECHAAILSSLRAARRLLAATNAALPHSRS